MPAVVAAVLCLVLTPLVLVVLRRVGVLDHPNERSSHDEPVIRGGGIALAIASVLAVPLALSGDAITPPGIGVVIAAGGLGVVGLIEDLWGIPALPRFLAQLAAAGLALPWLLSRLTGNASWRVVFGLGCLVFIVAYANAFNFMDGINGISAVQSAIAGGAWALLGVIENVDVLVWGGGILAGAAIGFLPYNFPNARLFLGDVGSYFIGGWQAALVAVGLRAGLPPEAVAAPVAIYLADTGTTLLRRVAAGEAWHMPHREHAYQRLIRQGWSHVRTTSVVGVFALACALLGALTLGPLVVRAVADIALACVVLVYLALPQLNARRVMKSAPRA